MKFAKYHNAMEIIKEMIEKKEIHGYSNTGEINYEGVYVCLDTNDFWLCRILKGYDEEYEESDGYLVERNMFSIIHVSEKLEEIHNIPIPEFKKPYLWKNETHKYLSQFTTEQIIKAVVLLDEEDSFGNWDCCEVETLEDAIEIIDGSFGIVEDF